MPYPTAVRVRLTSDSRGLAVLPFTMPIGLPSATTFFFQAVVLDPAAVQGMALSNALEGLTP